MKLLSKSDVAKTKGLERKQEIEEGAKLARKVDGLRELSSKEEANITKFREESVKELNSQILSKQEEIDELDKDIKVKKEIRDKLNEPLQTEWDKIDKAKADIESREKDLENRTTDVNRGFQKLHDDKFLFDRDKIFFEIEKLNHQKDKDYISSIQGETKALLEEQRRATDSVVNKEYLLNKALKEREQVVAERERAVKLEAENNKKVAMQHDKERVQLNDMRATLERAIKRIKN